MALVLSFPALGQISQAVPPTAIVMGTVIDVNGDVIPNATVVLKEVESNDPRTILTTENGMFEFHDVTPGIPYQLSISARDYEDWMSTPIILNPDQFKIVTSIQLRIATYRIIVDVHYDPVKVATEQFKAEEKQRVFGVIPNFYVSYESNPEPLTTRMKFKLALKVSTDPVTAAGVFLVASAKQAGNTPDYGQGWGAYGKRIGAVAADGFSDIMVVAKGDTPYQKPAIFPVSGATEPRLAFEKLSGCNRDAPLFGMAHKIFGMDRTLPTCA